MHLAKKFGSVAAHIVMIFGTSGCATTPEFAHKPVPSALVPLRTFSSDLGQLRDAQQVRALIVPQGLLTPIWLDGDSVVALSCYYESTIGSGESLKILNLIKPQGAYVHAGWPTPKIAFQFLRERTILGTIYLQNGRGLIQGVFVKGASPVGDPASEAVHFFLETNPLTPLANIVDSQYRNINHPLELNPGDLGGCSTTFSSQLSTYVGRMNLRNFD